MSRDRDAIRDVLDAFVVRWRGTVDSEKSSAQTFLNELITAYTGSGVRDSGGEFERPTSRDAGRGFIDMIWDGVVLVEMKAPKESSRLDTHRAQLLDYWRNSADVEKGVAAPPYAVLCSFDRFEVWEPGKFPSGPVDSFSLEELPDHVESLQFLARRKPVFGGPGVAVTREAAEHMVDLYFQLVDREAAGTGELHRWVMQTVWALFAEDLGLLTEHPVETLIQALIADTSRSTVIELSDLYRRLNTPDETTRNRARPTPVPYVNGELFAKPAEVHLEPGELEHLFAACRFDWRYVNPTIFGALMEGCLGHDRRWELGAHYTSEEDILSIVRPVIVHPWLERIETLDSPADGVALVEDLVAFKVLDPAMGCGNFLSIAYRELRAIERVAHEATTKLHHDVGLPAPLLPRYPIDNLYGIEIDPFAVEIAKVTLWMTHAIETRRYAASAENPLPLHPLTHLICADSLRADWPDVDAIIGNPPFHGDRNLRGVLGDSYIDWLKERFGIGVKDHCVYFFRKTHEELRPGQRAGLVATNTISQAKNRDASLGWILENHGVITDAISTMPWSGEAKVHVSVVCWVKGPYTGVKRLDGSVAEYISSSLRSDRETVVAEKLAGNKGLGFIGNVLSGKGFIIDESKARALIAQDGPDAEKIVKPFLNGDDLVNRPTRDPSRWVIDFNKMPLEEAEQFPACLAVVKELVKPVRDEVRRESYRKRWWQFAEPVPSMRTAIAGLERWGVASITAKRLLLAWGRHPWVPSHACVVFAIDDDYRFGILSSKIHDLWARTNASTLEDRLRYTPSNALETFPFPPNPDRREIERVATALRAIVELRDRYCLEYGIGLTKLYNLVDQGGLIELNQAHVELDESVAAAYGWDASIAGDDGATLDSLFDLNAKIAAGQVNYEPFEFLTA